ncbi:hypothetical protein HID58_015714 [Brassica napus]|uniref:Uncharacterized protein n=1 Tax=Brassica napus TaxID=3708 RepID=A0ABQ8DKW3_BRANA|nr:hypothetical protein HID58_015714 [Brassica napus]
MSGRTLKCGADPAHGGRLLSLIGKSFISIGFDIPMLSELMELEAMKSSSQLNHMVHPRKMEVALTAYLAFSEVMVLKE